MDENQYLELVEFITNGKIEVRKQALHICLQYSTTAEARICFKDTPIIRNILKVFEDEDSTLSALSLVIQFSQDEYFLRELIENHAILRICELTKEIMLNYYKQKAISEQAALTVDLCLLALSNITQQDQAKELFLQLNHNDINRCFYFKLFCNFFIDQRSAMYFSNFRPILLNVTSSQQARLELIKADYQMIPFFLKLLETQELFAIQILKNILFEYEQKEVMEAIKGQSIVNKIVDFMAQEIVKNHNLFDLEQGQAAFHLAVFEVNKSENCKSTPQARLQEAIRCLLILVNIDFAAEGIEFNSAKLEIALIQLRKLKNQFDSDQLDVIETVYLKVQQK